MAPDLIDELFLAAESDLAPGVRGVVDETPRVVTVMWLRATREGCGDVGRWLDLLPADRVVKFIAVTSDRLAGMLRRRGFQLGQTPMPSGDGWVPAYIRKRSAVAVSSEPGARPVPEGSGDSGVAGARPSHLRVPAAPTSAGTVPSPSSGGGAATNAAPAAQPNGGRR